MLINWGSVYVRLPELPKSPHDLRVHRVRCLGRTLGLGIEGAQLGGRLDHILSAGPAEPVARLARAGLEMGSSTRLRS